MFWTRFFRFASPLLCLNLSQVHGSQNRSNLLDSALKSKSLSVYSVFLEELMPKWIRGIEEFNIEGVIIAYHHYRVLFILINQLYFGDGVFDQELPLQSIIVVLNILSIIGLHTLEEALTPRLHQFLRLYPYILTLQLISTLTPFPINLDFIWLINFFLKSDLEEGLCVITIFFIFALELVDMRVYRLTSNKFGCFFV